MIIAGTGHRPNKLGGYEMKATMRLHRIATTAIAELKPDVIISGMAQGWDMAIAQCAINMKIPLWAYIPFIGQEQVWPQATRLYYQELLRRADKVEVCSEGGFTNAAMQHRNRRMVDDCTSLLAMWDGSPGGTANCIAYASFIDRPYTNLWEIYREQVKLG
jgi:uncharacterized phage-like protein YoqJ